MSRPLVVFLPSQGPCNTSAYAIIFDSSELAWAFLCFRPVGFPLVDHLAYTRCGSVLARTCAGAIWFTDARQSITHGWVGQVCPNFTRQRGARARDAKSAHTCPVNSNLMEFGVPLYASNGGPVVSAEPAWLPASSVAALASTQQASPVKPPSTSSCPSSSSHARSPGWCKWFWLPRPPSSSTRRASCRPWPPE